MQIFSVIIAITIINVSHCFKPSHKNIILRKQNSEKLQMLTVNFVDTARNLAVAPVMYALMSVNEYITHRYYQHAEVNKEPLLQKFLCFVMNLEKFPKVRGGGHVEHHAETYDDMTLRSDERWKKSPTAIALDADVYRGIPLTNFLIFFY